MHGIMRYGHLNGRFIELEDDVAAAGVADGWFQEAAEIPPTGIPPQDIDPENPPDPYAEPPASYVSWYSDTYGVGAPKLPGAKE